MKVLIADKLSAKAVSELEKLGAQVVVNPELTADDLAGALGNSEILIVRSTKVQAPAINSAPSLSLIIRAGAGVNTIDLDCASSKGIYVANCPGKNTDAVAELAIGLLIAADRRIVNAGSDMRSGVWNKKEYGKANGLKGRTLGIIGVGAIGKAVIKRAKGLDMKIIAWSRSLTEEKAKELDNRLLFQRKGSCRASRRH
jgi:D-3-phosphoglycerate dehydrogenase